MATRPGDTTNLVAAIPWHVQGCQLLRARMHRGREYATEYRN